MLGCLQCTVFCVLTAAGSETVLLDFYADWCGPCRAMTPLLDQLAQRGYPIRKVNIDQHPDLAARFGVRAVPCFVMLVQGREVGREIGQVSLARLEQLCQLGYPGRTGTRGSVGQGRRTADGLPIPVVQLGTPVQPSTKGASSEKVSNATPALAQNGAEEAGASAPAGTSAQQETGSPSALSEENLLACAVRLRVYHGNSQSCGSGTIIDARQGQALILTCGHLFRDSQGAGGIEVDLFGSRPERKVPGRLVAWNDQRDLGLVSIHTQGPIRTARVAPADYPLDKGLVVLSVGCNHGQDPTVRQTRIVSLNRYLGWPNLQTDDQPVEGRSGGGLFSPEGYLIGVCNAVDPADREGLYSSLPAIHAQLDDAQLQFVYRDVPYLPTQMPRPGSASPRPVGALSSLNPLGNTSPANQTDSVNPAAQANASFPRTFPPPSAGVGPSRSGSTNASLAGSVGPGNPSAHGSPASSPSEGHFPRESESLVSSQRSNEAPRRASPVASANDPSSGPLGPLSPEESSVLEEIARRHRQGAEVIFIVRPPNNPNAASEIFVLNRASPALLAQLGTTTERAAIRETSLALQGEPSGNPSEQSSSRAAGPTFPEIRSEESSNSSGSLEARPERANPARAEEPVRQKKRTLLPPPVQIAP